MEKIIRNKIRNKMFYFDIIRTKKYEVVTFYVKK